MASFPARRPIRRGGERGSAMIEFVLVTGLLIVPIFLGTISIGLSLVIANQVTEVCRDVGHMYAYGVNFSQAASKTLVTDQLAQNLSMTANGGKGVIYMSTITYVDSTSCTKAGLQADTGHCPNMNQTVVIKRLTIGNTSLKQSTFAPSITASIINDSGSIDASDYLTDASVRAANFNALITPVVDQEAYVTEMFVTPPAGAFWSILGSSIIAARSVF